MKVLMINGCPKANSNTAAALREVGKIFTAEEIENFSSTTCLSKGVGQLSGFVQGAMMSEMSAMVRILEILWGGAKSIGS